MFVALVGSGRVVRGYRGLGALVHKFCKFFAACLVRLDSFGRFQNGVVARILNAVII